MVTKKQIGEKQLPGEDGAKAIMMFDVDAMLLHFPSSCLDYWEMCAIISLAINTGYRGITLTSLVWENVKLTSNASTGDYRQLSMLFTKTKGPNKGFISASVDGMINDKRGRNVVYYLRQYLRFRLGDWSATLADLHKLKGKLFQKTSDDYSARIKKIGVNCGIPHTRLHGFRAGFLAEAMINAVKNGGSLKDAWYAAALAQGLAALVF